MFFADFTSLLFCHWAHTLAPVAAVPTRVAAANIKAEAVRAVGIIRRRTPVAAVAALVFVVRSITVAIASSGKKDAVAILFALYLAAIDAIARCPGPGTIIYEFIEL